MPSRQVGRISNKSRGARARDKYRPTLRMQNIQQEEVSSSEEESVLQVGGIRLIVSSSGDVLRAQQAAGRRCRRNKRTPQRKRPPSGSEEGELGSSVEEARDHLVDYLDNVAATYEASDSEDDGKLLKAMESFCAHKFCDDMDALDGLSASDLDSTSTSEADSDDSLSRHRSGEVSVNDIMDDFPALRLEAMYPVQARGCVDAVPPSRSIGRTRRGSRPKLQPKAASHGAAAELGQRQTKRTKLTAKRAVRAKARGLDLADIRQRMHNFVTRGGDLEAFPPMGNGNAFVEKLAALHHLKYSQQGSGRRKFVMVRMTERATVPEGKAAQKVKELQCFFESGAEQELLPRPSASRKAGGKAPKQLVKQPGGPKGRTDRFRKPVGFVSRGCLDDGQPEMVEIEMPTTLAAQQDSAVPFTIVQPSDMDANVPHMLAPPGFAAALLEGRAVQEVLEEGEIAHPGLGFIQQVLGPEGLATVHHSGEEAQTSSAAAGGSSGGDAMDEDAGREDEPELAGPLPSILLTKAQHKRAHKKLAKEQRRRGEQATKQPTTQTSLHFGGFERHSTGFGSKILLKWGYGGQGAGLGKDAQGIPEPLQAMMRPKQLGLGA